MLCLGTGHWSSKPATLQKLRQQCSLKKSTRGFSFLQRAGHRELGHTPVSVLTTQIELFGGGEATRMGVDMEGLESKCDGGCDVKFPKDK